LVLDYWPSLSNQALDGASTKWFKLTWFSFARSRMRPPLVITGRSAWYIASPSCLPKVLYRYNSFANPTVYGLEKNTKTFRRHHIHVMWFSSFYKGHYLKHYIPNLMKPNKRIEKNYINQTYITFIPSYAFPIHVGRMIWSGRNLKYICHLSQMKRKNDQNWKDIWEKSANFLMRDFFSTSRDFCHTWKSVHTWHVTPFVSVYQSQDGGEMQ